MTDTGLIERLREHLKLSYIGNCKCGECQLVPAPLIEEAATALLSLQGELATVRGALDGLYTAVSMPDFPVVPDKYYGGVLAARAALAESKP